MAKYDVICSDCEHEHELEKSMLTALNNFSCPVCKSSNLSQVYNNGTQAIWKTSKPTD